MDKFKILLLLLLFSKFSYSQDVRLSFDGQRKMSSHLETNKFSVDLIEKGIDSVCVFEIFRDTPKDSVSRYVIWKLKNLNKIKIIGLPNVVSISNENLIDFWDFIGKNFSQLVPENPETFSYIKGKSTHELKINEKNRKQYKFFLNNKTAEIWANDQDFNEFELVNNEKVQNIYFQDNQALLSKIVIEKLQKIITLLN